MGERVAPQMPSTSSVVTTVSPPHTENSSDESIAVLTLRPTAVSQARRNSKKVEWTEDTVDNENMNKKKSKCCCIYEKPRKFDESDSDSSDDECEHCFGHVENKKVNIKKKLAKKQDGGCSTVTVQQSSQSIEPPISINLPSAPESVSKPPESISKPQESCDVPDST